MSYRFALTDGSHQDLASGAVLRSAPGFPAFPVRLATEIFQRAHTLRGGGPVSVWDPCCGSGYLLTVLALLHRESIERVMGTDLDPEALRLAGRNLALLGDGGLEARSAELRERSVRFGKTSYAVAAEAAQRLAADLAARGGALPHRVARADAFDPDALRRALGGRRPDLVITDAPYGELTSWIGPRAGAGVSGMLRALTTVLDDEAVIAVAVRGRKVPLDGGLRPVATFRVGSRAVALFRRGELRSRSATVSPALPRATVEAGRHEEGP